MIYVLDTNSIIYFLQGYMQLEPVFSDIEKRKATPLISIITKIELLCFPRITSREEKYVRKLIDNFDVKSLDEEIVEKTVEIRKDTHLKIPDAVIAATCLIAKGILVTRDEKTFKKVKTIQILNPFNK